MFRLTREVRFAINDIPDDQQTRAPSNSYAGYPSLTGIAPYLRLQVCLEGKLNPQSCYLRNIKEIDQAVRRSLNPSRVLDLLHTSMEGVHSVTLLLSPFLSITQLASERGMHTRLSQKFEFSASHRLHNPDLSDDENRKVFGKCNNPNWHGHNYELQVTLKGSPNASGLLVNVPAFESIVKETVIDKLDHKNLNVEVTEFKGLIPTVEIIAMTIYDMLKNRFSAIGADLASVTVWETPKTWCEYSE
jgi:6-pyruvoyltetrahydropterin/6-carboxytetrahydropterin synthase